MSKPSRLDALRKAAWKVAEFFAITALLSGVVIAWLGVWVAPAVVFWNDSLWGWLWLIGIAIVTFVLVKYVHERGQQWSPPSEGKR